MQLACKSCGEGLDCSLFWKDKSKSNGYRSSCKKCMTSASKKWQQENVAKMSSYSRKYRATEAGKVKTAEQRKRYRAKYPEKREAQHLLFTEVRAGRIVPELCEVCGAILAEAHHDDYNKPLEVRWLCRQHHRDHHMEVSKCG